MTEDEPLSTVETVVGFRLEGLDLSSLDEESFVRLALDVISEAEDRDLMKTGCYTHDGPHLFSEEQEQEYDAAFDDFGEPPCLPIIWVKP